MAFRVFVRNWWKWEAVPGTVDLNRGGRPGRRLVPDPTARKTTLGKVKTEEEARQMCEQYARFHQPGKLSRKAEYEEIW